MGEGYHYDLAGRGGSRLGVVVSAQGTAGVVGVVGDHRAVRTSRFSKTVGPSGQLHYKLVLIPIRSSRGRIFEVDA